MGGCLVPFLQFNLSMERSKQILVIEDNHDMRVLLREHLENIGFTVSSVANGKDALTLLEEGLMPRVIILDLNMPLMCGEEFLDAKKNIQEINSVPVLIVSGQRPDQDLGNCYLEKPVDWKILTNAIEVYAL